MSNCSECLTKPCESPFNEDGECWGQSGSIIAAIAEGEWQPTNPPWWVKYPWADSIQEVWDEESNLDGQDE